MPDEKRAERDRYDDAVIAHFVELTVPGASWRPVLPRGGLPPDYLVEHGEARIGVELTEVLAESNTETGNQALHQHSVRRQIMQAAETLYTGPPPIVRPSWSHGVHLTNRDIAKLSMPLADVVAASTGRAPAGPVMLGWDDLAATDLTGYIDRLRVNWGGRITEPDWASGFPLWGVSVDAIQRSIDGKEAKLRKWSVPVTDRWLLLTLNLHGERFLDSASESTYAAAFEAVYCCDPQLRIVRLSAQPRG
jgi:hypothetical protein